MITVCYYLYEIREENFLKERQIDTLPPPGTFVRIENMQGKSLLPKKSGLNSRYRVIEIEQILLGESIENWAIVLE